MIEPMTPFVATALTITVVLAALAYYNRNADVVIWTGVSLLLCTPVRAGEGEAWQLGVLSVPEALAGFANEGVVTIGALFIIAAGMRETGALRWLTNTLLGSPGSERAAHHRILWPTALLSGFFNNTPLVAMLMPIAEEWGRRFRIEPSRLLMPLSFASILGGACTLIGTSTNLIINGWLIERTDFAGLQMFSITPVMFPIAIVGVLFIIYASPYLLTSRSRPFQDLSDAREYVVEMQVEPGSELAGKTIDEAGLRGLPGLFLIDIERDKESIPAVSGNVRLRTADHLVFAGVVDSVVDLQRFEGLRPATDQVFKIDEQRQNRKLLEAVVSDACPLVGQSIRDGQFRTNYNAAIIAVARNGERVAGRIGDIVLRQGDVLLLEARPSFLEMQRYRRDFYLVSQLDTPAPINTGKARIAFVLGAAMIAMVAYGLVSMLKAAVMTAVLMLAFRCVTPSTARRSIDWEVLLVIAGALALGSAMNSSGLADYIGANVLALTAASPHGLLAATLILTATLSAVVTAKAAAVLVLPVVVASAEQLGLNFLPFAVAVMLAASMTVATPIGYPTNLMVMGRGGYRFSDYFRLGAPLTLLIGVLGFVIIPIFWSW